MALMRKAWLVGLGLCLALGLSGGQAAAGPILDAGWDYDQIDFADPTPSGESPYVFVLADFAYFRITDYFVPGDTYFVKDFGAPLLTTVFDGPQPSLLPIGDPLGDLGWTSGDYSHGAVLLSPGPHSLSVSGDGVGGLPAGFYTRLDTEQAPEPTSLTLLGLGLAGLAFFRRRTRS